MSTRRTKTPSPDDPAQIERLTALVRGEARESRTVDLAIVAEAQAHGVHGLLRQALSVEPAPPGHAEAMRSLEAAVRGTALSDCYFRRQTIRAVAALRKAGIPALTFKGEAIACTHYPLSHLRARCDTDLLIAKRDVGRASDVLETLGYTKINTVAREAVYTQQVFTEPRQAIRHVIDLHWNVSYRSLLRSVFSFDELAQEAVAVGERAAGLSVPNPVHALVLACLHRVMHHENSTRLIWLYDIKLLADSLDDDEWNRVHSIASDKSLCEVCATGIELAAAFFGCTARTERHGAMLRELGRRRKEPSRDYLGNRRGPLERILLDARHAGTLPRAIQLVAGHVFPDAEYMRRRYDTRNRFSLAGSYLYRAARSVCRLAV